MHLHVSCQIYGMKLQYSIIACLHHILFLLDEITAIAYPECIAKVTAYQKWCTEIWDYFLQIKMSKNTL